MVAALTMWVTNPRVDLRRFDDHPGARTEFALGHDFMAANGIRGCWDVTVARWACIPFTLVGALVCWRWASELHGANAGVLASALWCFCPNILAHAELITPDLGVTALMVAASYLAWHWLRDGAWHQAILCGIVLGLAALAKATALLLFMLLPVAWIAKLLCFPERGLAKARAATPGQLVAILTLALGIINAGYGFQSSLVPLGRYAFISRILGGVNNGRISASDSLVGNRFTSSWFAAIPVPLPSDYVRGIDIQEREFQSGYGISYLCGTFRSPGWWYFYLYALIIKVPLGTWCMGVFAIALTWMRRGKILAGFDDFLVIGIAVTILTAASIHTGLTMHLRYVLPCFPFAFVYISRIAESRARSTRCIVLPCLCWSVFSSLVIYPNSLSYFNELVGGPAGGPRHLLDSNIDWGQDLLNLMRWRDRHPEARSLTLAYFGGFDPCSIAGTIGRPPLGPAAADPERSGPKPGWYAVSVNELYGYSLRPYRDPPDAFFGYFRHFKPIAKAGYSIYIYHITPDELMKH
jgi:4-amino-4-deoxy-L-arabinose transferase-like glycosyltransferase